MFQRTFFLRLSKLHYHHTQNCWRLVTLEKCYQEVIKLFLGAKKAPWPGMLHYICSRKT